MKRLNLKLVIILLLGAVLTIAGVYGANKFQTGSRTNLDKQTADEENAAAATEAKDGNKEAALKHKELALKSYMKYLRSMPEDKETVALATRLAIEIFHEIPNPANYQAASTMEHAAFRTDPENPAVRKMIAEFLISTGVAADVNAAIEHLIWLTSLERNLPEKEYNIPAYKMDLVNCYVARNQDDEAKEVCAR